MKVADGATKVEMNRPCVLDASFCEGTGIVTDLGSPRTMHKLLQSKENKLAATYNIELVSCEKIALRKPEIKLTPDLAPEFHYPLYPLVDPNELLSSHTTPQKKMFFLDNDEDRDKLSTQSSNAIHQSDDAKTELRSTSPAYGDREDGATDIPNVKKVPDYMNIPNLWNVQLIEPETEKQPDDKESLHPESSSSSSEWELFGDFFGFSAYSPDETKVTEHTQTLIKFLYE